MANFNEARECVISNADTIIDGSHEQSLRLRIINPGKAACSIPLEQFMSMNAYAFFRLLTPKEIRENKRMEIIKTINTGAETLGLTNDTTQSYSLAQLQFVDSTYNRCYSILDTTTFLAYKQEFDITQFAEPQLLYLDSLMNTLHKYHGERNQCWCSGFKFTVLPDGSSAMYLQQTEEYADVIAEHTALVLARTGKIAGWSIYWRQKGSQ